jgi:hypothetical protein
LHRNIFANVPKPSDSRTCSLQRMVRPRSHRIRL